MSTTTGSRTEAEAVGSRTPYSDSKTWLLANRLMWWRRLHKPTVDLPTTFCGDSIRFGWAVAAGSLTPSSIVYSFGIGTNASFEEQAMRDFGCQVYAFDPTPRSVAWVRSQGFPSGFHFRETGISDADGELEFAAPESSDDISYSAVPEDASRSPDGVHGSRSTVKARVATLRTIMQELGHSKIDLLKMDVEGCEYRVIENLASSSIRPKQLLVEFHQGFYGCTTRMTLDSVKTLRDIGYDIFWVSSRGLEYGFVYRGAH